MRTAAWGMVMLLACTPLVQRTSSERPDFDVPYGKPFPSGTRGLVVARDTLWAGSLEALPGSLAVAYRVFPLKEIRCVSYRFPKTFRPAGPALEGVAAALPTLVMGADLLADPCGCPPDEDPVSCALGLMFCVSFKVTFGAAMALATAHMFVYPRKRLREHLYRYALSPDPAWQNRCAEILHFYAPLLDSVGFFQVPLEES